MAPFLGGHFAAFVGQVSSFPYFRPWLWLLKRGGVTYIAPVKYRFPFEGRCSKPRAVKALLTVVLHVQSLPPDGGQLLCHACGRTTGANLDGKRGDTSNGLSSFHPPNCPEATTITQSLGNVMSRKWGAVCAVSPFCVLWKTRRHLAPIV